MPEYNSYWFKTMEEAMDYLEKCGYTIDRTFTIYPPKPVPPYWESLLEFEAIMTLVHGWDCAYARDKKE